MKLKFNENTYNLESFSFSNTNAWFTFTKETVSYEDIISIFSDLDVDILMEIYTEDDDILESHVGYNFLQSVTYNTANDTFVVELIKEPLAQRLTALEETIDFLLMEEL